MELSEALKAIAAIGDLAQSIASGEIEDTIKSKADVLARSIMPLQGALFSLHSENRNLHKIKENLEQRIEDLVNWEKDAERYLLHSLAPGAFAYSLKEEHHDTEPHHYLCPSCFHDKRKSFLHLSPDGDKYACSRSDCETEVCCKG